MADTENREDQKISECLREAFGYSDDQLLKQLDQANETFKDVNFTGAEDRLMKRFLARKAELEKETASQTPTLVPQNESANIQIAEELPKKTVTVISEAEEKKKNEKKVIRFGKKKVLATAALVAVIAGMLGGTAIGKKSYFFRRSESGQYSIYIDNKFVFGLSGVDVLYYRLKIGNEIPQEKYDEILENVIYEKAKNTAVKFLGYRARSKKELRDKLIKDYDENITDKVISMLEKYGYVNDEEYAKAYVRDCLNLKGWGQKRISLELTKRGIDKNIIEKALPKENTEQLELIEKLLTKRLKGNTNIDFKEKKKHFDYLARRGFLPSDILEVFDKILVKEDW